MNYDSLIAAAEKAGTPDVLVELDGAFTSLRKEYGCWLKTDGTDIGAPDVEEKLEYPPGLDAVLDMTQGLDSKVHFKQRTSPSRLPCSGRRTSGRTSAAASRPLCRGSGSGSAFPTASPSGRGCSPWS